MKTPLKVKLKKCNFRLTRVFLNIIIRIPREHEGTERVTEGVGCDMS